GHDIGFYRSALDRTLDADDLLAKEIDVATDDIVQRRSGAAIGDELRLQAQLRGEEETRHVRRRADTAMGLFHLLAILFQVGDKVSRAVQEALMGALGVPPDDFFQIIHILPRSQFLHTPSFLGLKYSDDLILLELTFISGRPKEKRL